MKKTIDGKALVYAGLAFNTPEGKTAHGLVRFTRRYDIVGVIDPVYAGQDAGLVLDGRKNGIPIYESFSQAMKRLKPDRLPQTLVIGLAPDGGRLPAAGAQVVQMALEAGLNVDSGLHDFLYKNKKFVETAQKTNCRIRDIRRTPDRDELHFFTGKIEEVDCLKVAVLGTDSAVGKRTSAWIIVHEAEKAGLQAQMVGTGQTAWMQGARYSMIMDSCINDFVSGEIEHAVHEAWKNEQPDLILIEGQGSLMNPAYPGGFEILAAGRPDYVILQHAPMRKDYDGFPGYPIQPLADQINAIEVISNKKVIAVTLNHEMMDKQQIPEALEKIRKETGLPAFDVLENGAAELVTLLRERLK